MTKSIEFKDKNNTTNNDNTINTNNQNNNNDLATNSTEKNKNIFFKINYNFDHNLYYLIDMKIGYGTFYKIEERTIIYENSIINIGESYLIFSFNKSNIEGDNNINEDDLFLKIYSSEGEYNPMIIQSCGDKIYKLGRTEKCDVYPKDYHFAVFLAKIVGTENAVFLNLCHYELQYQDSLHWRGLCRWPHYDCYRRQVP